MHQRQDTERSCERARSLLAGLADSPAGFLEADDVTVVVAHPDDETIGCGGQLFRLRGVRVVLVTDGAPRPPAGPSHPSSRSREWHAALSVAAVPIDQRHELGIPDQSAAFAVREITDELAALFRRYRTRMVLTHAYEGGHPDHDATALAVHRAAGTLARDAHDVTIVEMPFYRSVEGCFAWQSFVPLDDCPAAVAHLDAHQVRIKRAMCEAHASQAGVLRHMAPDHELFRLAPAHDFRSAANGGQLLYERYDWGLDGAGWRALVEALAAPECSPDAN